MSLIVLAAFFGGLIVGLIIGPDSEREYAAKVEGWLAGHAYTKGKALDHSQGNG